jgi:hypothetical protein
MAPFLLVACRAIEENISRPFKHDMVRREAGEKCEFPLLVAFLSPLDNGNSVPLCQAQRSAWCPCAGAMCADGGCCSCFPALFIFRHLCPHSNTNFLLTAKTKMRPHHSPAASQPSTCLDVPLLLPSLLPTLIRLCARLIRCRGVYLTLSCAKKRAKTT